MRLLLLYVCGVVFKINTNTFELVRFPTLIARRSSNTTRQQKRQNQKMIFLPLFRQRKTRLRIRCDVECLDLYTEPK